MAEKSGNTQAGEPQPMNPTRTPRFVQQPGIDPAAERARIAAALQCEAARAEPKYFYDALGSQLFEAITQLPEYYPTRTEAAIFDAHAAEIAAHIGGGATLFDLGAGNCAKALRLFPLLEPSRYVAIDISVDFLRAALRRVQRAYPLLDVVGLGQDFSSALALPEDIRNGRPVFFYPGSSIGNYTPPEALAFLQRVHRHAAGGGLLIGVDLLKPAALLEAAYDDALGLTAAFDLNLLRNLNRLIGSDFDPRQWRHRAHFDAAQSRIDMHLEARCALRVRWPGGGRDFRAGERVHTEHSCKYTVAGFAALLREAGFAEPLHWTDANDWFAVFWAPVAAGREAKKVY
jgi:dimethylhistidine N-methyltransferase